MPSFIFGENSLTHPVFVLKNTGKNYVLIAEGIKNTMNNSTWRLKVLQEYKNHPFLRKCLREGIRITLSNHDILFVRSRWYLFYSNLQLRIGSRKLKGRPISKNKITF